MGANIMSIKANGDIFDNYAIAGVESYSRPFTLNHFSAPPHARLRAKAMCRHIWPYALTLFSCASSFTILIRHPAEKPSFQAAI